jgi:ADP-heptose:LPS heptosyltransferase
MELIDLTSQVIDLADLAALMMNLDLIISVDSAPAHLAGAMGKPVWTLLPLSAHYQWMCQREDSPWYPGMRLFQADRFGDWSGVAQNVASALRQRATGS